MTTVLDIITSALRVAGVIASGEAPSATEAQDAFAVLNDMLDADSTESLMIYNNVQEVFPLVSGQSQYTIGTGGDFNTDRPINITAAYMRDINDNDLPVYLMNAQEYGAIISKGVEATIALSMYYNPTFPLGTITWWPVVAASTYRAVIWSWKKLTNFATLSDQIILPPGYLDYLRWNLAFRYGAMFNVQLPGNIEKLAISSKAKLKRINIDIPIMSLPVELINTRAVTNFPVPPGILTGN
jgi:hypothetical protein